MNASIEKWELISWTCKCHCINESLYFTEVHLKYGCILGICRKCKKEVRIIINTIECLGCAIPKVECERDFDFEPVFGCVGIVGPEWLKSQYDIEERKLMWEM